MYMYIFFIYISDRNQILLNSLRAEITVKGTLVWKTLVAVAGIAEQGSCWETDSRCQWVGDSWKRGGSQVTKKGQEQFSA